MAGGYDEGLMAASNWSEELESREEAIAFPADSPAHVPAWERVEEGRYRPLRTRGSFPGRELG
jgi:hypothetical protein